MLSSLLSLATWCRALRGAFYENKFMKNCNDESITISGIRYMDDLFAIASYANSELRPHASKLLQNLSVAYHPKMELECEDTSLPFKFLCSLVRSNEKELDISYYNRNYQHLVTHNKQLFPIFQHWHSHSPAKQKLAIVISTFHRVTRACDSFANVITAANQIAYELIHLKYPLRILLLAAGRLATADGRWATIRSAWRTSTAVELLGEGDN